MCINYTDLNEYLTELYDQKSQEYQKNRYFGLIEQFFERFKQDEIQIFSVPGRTELGGNHTDHNHGRVLAAGINLDTIAVAARSDDNTISIQSHGFDNLFSVSLDQLEPDPAEKGDTAALIRGIAARIRQLGYEIGGFKACVASDVLVGSGLSSSASFEVMIGAIINNLYNEDKIGPEVIAKIGQYSENVYFGKPCGLMDQLACAMGGIIAIDFKNPQDPRIESVAFDFSDYDFQLVVVDTGGSHADLTEDYVAVPVEMKSVASFFNANVCRELRSNILLKNIRQLRDKLGDRAILRAMHFLIENERVARQVSALKNQNFEQFIELVSESGNSSFKWLQNIYSPKSPEYQGLSMALLFTEQFLRIEDSGACRVHGGGFAGTIQAYIPTKRVQDYTQLMKTVFGGQAVNALSIRNTGVRIFTPAEEKLIVH